MKLSLSLLGLLFAVSLIVVLCKPPLRAMAASNSYDAASTTDSCSTPTTGSTRTCTIAMTWANGGFSDTNYAASCSPANVTPLGDTPSPLYSILVQPANKTKTGLTVVIVSLGSGGIEVSGLDCVAVHL